MTETPSTYIGTYVDYTEADSTDPKKYTWVKFMGEDGKDGQDGIAGTNGVDGKTQYLHIKYSDDGLTFTSGNLFSKDVSKWESGYYMNVKREQAYTICTPYFIPVTPGAQYTISVSVTGYSIGITQYGAAEDSAYVTAGVTTNVTYRSFTPPASTTYVRLYIRSVDTSATFETLSAALKSGELVITMIKKDAVLGEEPGAWIGTLVDFNEKDSTVFSDYTWNKVVGENGTPGEPGEDGRTQYLHIKYSDDGQTFTANNGEELGAWIGTLVDFNEKDSDVFSDYTWKLFTEDVTEELEDIRQTIIEQQTSIINTCDSIVMSALKSYVETSTYEEFKSALETEFKVWAEGISATVTATEQSITEVDGDLQQKFNQITKYFTFDINGLTIGQEDNQNKVVIDNDEITILVNNMPIQKFTAEGKALIPDLKVTTQANFMGLRITEDATNINCDYNGG